MNTPPKADELTDEDRGLVNLVESVLVDPAIHTDTRMRLAHQISDLLRDTHAPSGGPAGPAVQAPARPPVETPLPEALETVLTDPNLHTDARLRIHREIRELVRAER
jgi:hypothetical protein